MSLKLPPDTVMRLARVNDGLRGAIDLTRKIVEELRPTLLDSMGLFAALSWQFGLGCRLAGIKYTESFPASAPDMDAHSLITLFRIAQELFNVALQRESVSMLSLAVSVNDETLHMTLSVDGSAPRQQGQDSPSVPMLSILHRVRQLQGEVEMTATAAGICNFHVSVPQPKYVK
jgi:signal transduction histidine kinase